MAEAFAEVMWKRGRVWGECPKGTRLSRPPFGRRALRFRRAGTGLSVYADPALLPRFHRDGETRCVSFSVPIWRGTGLSVIG